MPDYRLAQIWCARVECQKKSSNKRKRCKNGIFPYKGRTKRCTWRCLCRFQKVDWTHFGSVIEVRS